MSVKIGFEDLTKNIIERGICVGCGACVVVCPYKGILDYSEGKPKLVGECKVCGICLRVCPRYAAQIDELENLVFGCTRKPNENFGVCREIHVAKSTDGEIMKRCQDGGVATALINFALDSGMIDAAIISSDDPSIPWLPIPFIAVDRSEVIRCAGTRYTYSPTLLALGRYVAEGSRRKVAFVGTPCQIQALRRIQKVPLKKFVDIVALTIGLFCSESFTYEGLMLKKIQGEMGIDLKDLEKMNIKGKMLLILKNGKSAEIPLKEARSYAEAKCRYCGDFSAELADISVGGVGLKGRTFTVVRTEQGEKVLHQAMASKTLDVKPAKEFIQAYELLVRLSKLKERNAQSTRT